MSKKIKSKVRKFVHRHSLHNADFMGLKKAAEESGFTIVEYNSIINDTDVSTIIEALNLGESVLHSRGFTYVDKSYRLIFVNTDLNDEEKTLVLAHELGHIELEHFNISPIIGNDVRQEYEANEFAHYLLNRHKSQKIVNLIACHKRVIFIIGLLLFMILLIFLVSQMIEKEQSYIGNYYITTTGNKYHRKDCIFVKERTNVKRLTKEEFENGNYEACDMCLPDKQQN